MFTNIFYYMFWDKILYILKCDDSNIEIYMESGSEQTMRKFIYIDLNNKFLEYAYSVFILFDFLFLIGLIYIERFFSSYGYRHKTIFYS